MDSAKLIHEKIEIYRPTQTITEYGSYVDDYVKVGETRAGTLTQTMNRDFEGDEIRYAQSRTITVRMYVDIRELDEIRWDNERWIVDSVTKDKTYNNKVIKLFKLEQ